MSGSQLQHRQQQNAIMHPYGNTSGGRIVAAANYVLQRREGVVGVGTGGVPRSLGGETNQHVHNSFSLSSSSSSITAGTTPSSMLSSSISTPSNGDRDDDSRGSHVFNRGGVKYIINFGLHEVKRTVQGYVSTLPTRVYPFK